MDYHLLNKNLQYPFSYNEAYAPIQIGTFEYNLNKAIAGNKEAILYIDNCTINRIYGFDLYSKSYWGLTHDGSICACVPHYIKSIVITEI